MMHLYEVKYRLSVQQLLCDQNESGDLSLNVVCLLCSVCSRRERLQAFTWNHRMFDASDRNSVACVCLCWALTVWCPLFCKQCSRIPACEPLDGHCGGQRWRPDHCWVHLKIYKDHIVCVCVCEGRWVINVAYMLHVCLCIKSRCYFALPVFDLVFCASKLNLTLMLIDEILMLIIWGLRNVRIKYETVAL